MPSRVHGTTRSFFWDSSDKDSGGSGRVLTPTSRRRITLDDSFTINQLRFSSLGLYGREKDFDTLKVAFKNVGSTNCKRGLVLLSGHAGTGKVKSTFFENSRIDFLDLGSILLDSRFFSSF